MNHPPSRSDDQAATWAHRLSSGPLAREEAVRLQDWLDGAPGREALLEDYCRLQGRLGAVVPGLLHDGSAVLPGPVFWRRAQFWRRAAGLAAAAVIAFAAVWLHQRPEQIRTGVAHRQTLTLDDGTTLALNARTAIAVRLRAGERHVRLESGEVFFEVARDGRPFFVETPAGTVRVTGTAFNVRTDDSDALEVTVLEGSVVVQPGNGTELRLEAYDQFGFDGATAAVRGLAAAAARDVAAWREGRVVFDGTPVRVALGRFARYHGREITVAPEVETLRLGGVFKLDDLEGFLRDIEAVLPVKLLRGDKAGPVRVLPR